jgi:hypothetical protein
VVAVATDSQMVATAQEAACDQVVEERATGSPAEDSDPVAAKQVTVSQVVATAQEAACGQVVEEQATGSLAEESDPVAAERVNDFPTSMVRSGLIDRLSTTAISMSETV